MCSDRLAAGEAPACVQACPHEAIRDPGRRHDRGRRGRRSGRLPARRADPDVHAAHDPVQVRRGPCRANLLPADHYQVAPEHAHPPLVVMLVLTQLVGRRVSVVGCVARRSRPCRSVTGRRLGRSRVIASASGLLALGASTLHLGPAAVRLPGGASGCGHSWLSREVAGVRRCSPSSRSGLRRRAAALALHRAAPAARPASRTPWARGGRWRGLAGVVLLGDGLPRTAGRSGARPHAAFKFVGTALRARAGHRRWSCLGGDVSGRLDCRGARGLAAGVAWLLAGGGRRAKLALEAGDRSCTSRDTQHAPLKRTARLLTGELAARGPARGCCWASSAASLLPLPAARGSRLRRGTPGATSRSWRVASFGCARRRAARALPVLHRGRQAAGCPEGWA